ncbi:prolyl oligopeptidase [Schistosoma bovis]|uniref:Prolyl oligopeptidase n=1 Tax=Schistosoma bovis TaxID=6184 RepID=A0A430QNE8_SCHBO|nr:prolyl oligopeptidase [Schistosoma bovis]
MNIQLSDCIKLPNKSSMTWSKDNKGLYYIHCIPLQSMEDQMNNLIENYIVSINYHKLGEMNQTNDLVVWSCEMPEKNLIAPFNKIIKVNIKDPDWSNWEDLIPHNPLRKLEYATCIDRNEFGEEWHKSGSDVYKSTAIDDLLAAAEYLIQQKYTNPDNLILQGNENGGLLAASCANKKPNLFKAIILDNPLTDMLRYYKYSSTGRWMSEYGNLYYQNVFNELFSYSPVHNVPNLSMNKSYYPSVLILSDLQTANVEYIHSLKLLATLQNELHNNGFLMGARYSKKRHKPRISKSQIPWLLRGAIRSNNVGTLQYLFSYPNGVDPSMVIDGVCPLNLAVELGYLQMVKILIKAGADIYVADAPRYPLHQASLYGRADIAELLIRSGASVSALTERRQSCLHLLAHQTAQRYVDTAKILLKYHVNPNTLDDDGLAPLHRASVEIVEVLVAHETTDVNICSRDLDTPLLTAVKDRRELILIALIRADQQFREQHRKNNTTTSTVATTTTATTLETQSNDGQCRVITSALRTPSSKSSNSASSRFTLASATSTIFRGIIPNDCIVPPRASSAASVNLHSILNTNHSKPLNIDRHILSSQLLRMKPMKVLDDHDTELECDTNRINIRSCILRLSGKNHIYLNSESNGFTDGSDSQCIVKSTYSGSSNLTHTIVRKPENCQRCHSVGNPSDVARWWQSCDRVQRILCKTTLINTSTNNNSNNVNNPTSQTTQLPLNLKNGQQSNTGTIRPRLDIDRPDKIGMTPLMIAAEAGSSGLNMAIALVNAGSNLSLTDKVGMTALHHACYVGSLNMVRYLMERVHPIISCNNVTTTTTTTICTTTATTTATTSASISKTNNLLNGSNARLSCLLSASIISSLNAPTSICPTNNSNSNINVQSSMVGSAPPPLTTSRLSNPELINTQDKYGRTLIYLAACRGHSEVVNYLLCHSADIHITNKENKSPLYISAYFATYHGRSEIVDLLLTAGANVNAADKNGKTPLYVAVLHGHLALARKLLDAGASVNRVDREGLGPLHMAVKFPKLDIPMVKLLLNYGCDPVNLASFTRWLLVHGIIPEECIHGDDELAQWLRWEECNVHSLKHICRVVIQRALGYADSLRIKANRLPLPEHLISYVSMKQL